MNPQEMTAYGAPPKPLFNPETKVLLIFSAKSACSSSVIWFFHAMGLAEEAENYHRWPHKYRVDIFSKNPEIRQALQQTPLEELKIVKVLRDPIDRAASGYRHALGTGYTNPAIQAAIGIDPAQDGMSFRQFIDFLETENLANCDIHHRLQRHALEDLRAPDRIINISRQDLFTELNAFEEQFDLPVTDFSQLSWLHNLHKERTPPLVQTPENVYEEVFTSRQALRGPWPKSIMTPEARERLARLYATDIAHYGSL